MDGTFVDRENTGCMNTVGDGGGDGGISHFL